MTIDFAKTFGARSSNSAAGRNSKAEDRPKTQLWMNIGYETGDENYPFLSLPVGIPLDNQEHVKANSSNADFAAFCAARNGLLDSLIAAGETLAPGEDMIIGVEGSPLQIQIRRIGEERAEAVADASNKFVKQLKFVDA